MVNVQTRTPAFPGHGNNMGPPPSRAPSSFEILYFDLQATKPANGGPAFLYLSKGSYQSSQYPTIDGFIDDFVNGNPMPPAGLTHNTNADQAPDIVVTTTCYVVVRLWSSDQDPTFVFQSTPFTIQDDLPQEYLDLQLTPNAKTAYFLVKYPLSTPEEYYKIFMQYGSGSGIQPWPYDPKIKNRGGN